MARGILGGVARQQHVARRRPPMGGGMPQEGLQRRAVRGAGPELLVDPGGGQQRRPETLGLAALRQGLQLGHELGRGHGQPVGARRGPAQVRTLAGPRQ